ncbi:hypothetical protein NEOLEDRAFT_1184591 [Neolentinus lepideus HHB14362 ss-1]|uniref:CCHC-type domain-containing protein n=1 Tax=Neolentinus lepideus HHB14362 ss-1 TaxID=1314782 RepID=A0A165MA43_9AGAM|nr:hypothetical protein NEOLEDRAFT_1184591 [Neolentinus lepideus HHB14362 ss-1]
MNSLHHTFQNRLSRNDPLAGRAYDAQFISCPGHTTDSYIPNLHALLLHHYTDPELFNRLSQSPVGAMIKRSNESLQTYVGKKWDTIKLDNNSPIASSTWGSTHPSPSSSIANTRTVNTNLTPTVLVPTPSQSSNGSRTVAAYLPSAALTFPLSVIGLITALYVTHGTLPKEKITHNSSNPPPVPPKDTHAYPPSTSIAPTSVTLSTTECWQCHEMGHKRADCPSFVSDILGGPPNWHEQLGDISFPDEYYDNASTCGHD